MHDLPLTALILSIAAILICAGGGIVRALIYWHEASSHAQSERERGNMIAQMLSAFFGVIETLKESLAQEQPGRDAGDRNPFPQGLPLLRILRPGHTGKPDCPECAKETQPGDEAEGYGNPPGTGNPPSGPEPATA
jgi:hypothetical protein